MKVFKVIGKVLQRALLFFRKKNKKKVRFFEV
nr:MAG TPA: hypothetical protein [Caudoviricetes sp.]